MRGHRFWAYDALIHVCGVCLLGTVFGWWGYDFAAMWCSATAVVLLYELVRDRDE